MHILKNRRVSVFITAIVIVLSSVIGINRSLNRFIRDIERSFSDTSVLLDVSEKVGVEIKSINSQKSMQYDIDATVSAAQNIEKIMLKYYGSESADIAELRKCISDLQGADSINQKYLNYKQLVDKINQIDEGIRAYGIGDYYDSYSGQLANITAAQKTIKRNSYNDIARKFNQDITGGFPANIISGLFNIKACVFE